MKIQYKHFNFRDETLNIIEQANEFIANFDAEGYTPTLRQIYYQFIGHDLLPNTERSYNRLQSIITNGRLAGLISWTSVEDRNRTCRTWSYNEDELEAVRGIEYHISVDFWARQDFYLEAWIEKDALINILERPCRQYDVPHMACKGYLSASEAWRAGRRFKRKADEGKKCILLHLGDHDPSGIDMTRDNAERLEMFGEYANVEVKRLALNMDQIEEYQPPPNPAKTTDSRATGYIDKYGTRSWELDALKPRVISNLVETEINKYIDHDLWDECVELETEKRAILEKVHDNWDEVRPFLEEL